MCLCILLLISDNSTTYLSHNQTSSTASNSSLKRIRQHKTMRYISTYVTTELVKDMENITYGVNSAKSDKDAKLIRRRKVNQRKISQKSHEKLSASNSLNQWSYVVRFEQ